MANLSMFLMLDGRPVSRSVHLTGRFEPFHGGFRYAGLIDFGTLDIDDRIEVGQLEAVVTWFGVDRAPFHLFNSGDIYPDDSFSITEFDLNFDMVD